MKHTRSTSRRSHARIRSAVTLIELLVVMGVVVLLAGLTLPSVRSMLKDQRITESARILQGMIDAARAKAIYTGRPVSLLLERVPANPSASTSYNEVVDNTCTRVSIGETFPPYEGDWAGATGTVTLGTPNQLEISLAKVASLIDITTSTPTGLIQTGDLLQLGDRSQMFQITGLTTALDTSGLPVVRVTFLGPAGSEAQWTTSGEVRFRMFRRPTKSLVGAVSLPRGTCVDLTVSGIGVSQVLGSSTSAAFEVGPRPAISPVNYFSSLAIVFNSRGSVDQASYFVGGTLASYSPTGLMYLLVGRPEQVVPTTQIGTGAISSRDDFKENLLDTTNLWVTINPFSGNVYTAQNFSTSAAARIVQIAEARTLASRVLASGKN